MLFLKEKKSQCYFLVNRGGLGVSRGNESDLPNFWNFVGFTFVNDGQSIHYNISLESLPFDMTM